MSCTSTSTGLAVHLQAIPFKTSINLECIAYQHVHTYDCSKLVSYEATLFEHHIIHTTKRGYMVLLSLTYLPNLFATPEKATFIEALESVHFF